MSSRSIKIRLIHNQVVGLNNAYATVIPEYGPENAHECLLLEMAGDMHHMLRKMEVKEQQQYTLCVTSSQALAFYYFWSSLKKVALPHYSATAVQKVFEIVDKKSKAPRIHE